MSSRPRKILIIAVVLLVVLGGGVFFVTTQLDSIVAGQIEKHGSAATKTDVRVSGVSIDLKAARAGLSGLTVANPEGYSGDPAIELGDFSVRIDPGSITSDTIVLNEVTVSGARLRLLQQGAASNLKTLLDNLQGDSTGGNADSAPGKKIVIDRFVLEDARAFVSVPELDENREVVIPRIELTGIGRNSNGATASQAARQILQPILQRTMRTATAEAVKDKAKEKLDEAKDNVLQGVMDRIGGSDDEPQEPN